MDAAHDEIWAALLRHHDDNSRSIVVADDRLVIRAVIDRTAAGMGPGPLVGHPARVLIHPDDLDRAAAAIAEAAHPERRRPSGLYRILTGGGYRALDVAVVREVGDSEAGRAIVFLVGELDDRRRAEVLAKEQIEVLALLAARAPIEDCLAALTQLAARHVDRLTMEIVQLTVPLPSNLADRAPHVVDALERMASSFAATGPGDSVVITPIRSLDGRLLGYAEGRRDHTTVPSSAEWSVHELVAGLAGLFIERVREDERLSHAATHDPLTDLANRRLLAGEMERLCAGDEPFGLAVVDLDQFAWVNNTLGHLVGDQVLVETGRRLRATVGERAVVARPGGDEFVVVVPGISTLGQLESLGRRLHRGLLGPAPMLGPDRHIQASIGLALRRPGDGPDQLLAAADAAMYVAKKAGGDACHVPEPVDRAGQKHRFDLVRALADAIDRDELHLVYQPIIELSSHRWVSVEALVRWERDGRVVAGPREFVALAEQSDLILTLDEWVLRAAGAQLQLWKQASELPLDGVVWVNLSRRTIARADLVELIGTASGSAARDGGIQALRLGIEVTERVVDTDPGQIALALGRVRAAGIPVALDDFGTGVASLQHLAEFPATHLKIDGSFVDRMLHSETYRTLAEVILLLARRLGLKVTAEAVENRDQLELLARLGCDHAQGYLISAPRRARDLAGWSTHRMGSPAPVDPLP